MRKNINIYLVDDDRIFSVIAEVTLSKIFGDINFYYLTNGMAALESIEACPIEHHPTILFLDINMPVLDGWGFLAALEKLQKPQFPICMTSSSIDPKDRQLANDHPRVIDFVEKPFDKIEIEKLINPLIRHS